MIKRLLLILFLVLSAPVLAQKGQFMTVEEYQQTIFLTPIPWQTLWVSKQDRDNISDILSRQFMGLRIRYWAEGNKTAWIFEEIGKELPITVGIAINDGQVVDVTILEYRESRGGEVRHDFFTDQFLGSSLESKPTESTTTIANLNTKIDGITGATYSVRSLKNMVRLALYCHTLTPFADYQEPLSLEEPSP
jgi:hypothetical protein